MRAVVGGSAGGGDDFGGRGSGAYLRGVSLNMMKGLKLMGRGSRALRYISYLQAEDIRSCKGDVRRTSPEVHDVVGVRALKVILNQLSLQFAPFPI